MRRRGILIGPIALAGVLVTMTVVAWRPLGAYPPAVGILGPSRNCLTCHINNGPWKDDLRLVIDVLDQRSGKSLKQEDGSFLVGVRRGETKTVLTVIGTTLEPGIERPYRNAWLYIDPRRISDPTTLSKFAPGWTVNLPMSCRIVGDNSPAHPGSLITSLPMTVRPGDDAQDAEIELQVMLTRGEAVKGKPLEGMVGSYFERKVRLKVL